MHPFYIRLSRVFIPASNSRKPFTFPELYPLPKNYTHIQQPIKQHLQIILNTSLLNTIISILLSDIDAWCTDYQKDSYAKQARWMAERMLIWMYDLDVIRESYHVQSIVQDTLNLYFDEAKVMFFTQFPELKNNEYIQVPSFSTRDFWVALQSFNLYRFRLVDSLESFEESEKIPYPMFDLTMLDDTEFAEVQLIYATRVREHAVFGILLAAGDIVQEANPIAIPTAATMMRKYLRLNPKKSTFDWKHNCATDKTNVSAVLSLVRTIVHMYYKIRLVVDVLSPLGNIEQAQLLIHAQASWCEVRIPSLLALKASTSKKFFNAVRNFEAACIEEQNCLTSLSTSKNILVAALEAKNIHFYKPSFLRLHLALSKENLDSKLFQKLSDGEKARIEERFAHVQEFTKPTMFAFVAFFKMYQFYDVKFQAQDCVEVITKMLVSKEFYRTFEKVVNNPSWIQAVKETCNDSVPYSLHYVLKKYQKRLDEKMEGTDTANDAFSTIELPEQEFVDLVKLAKVRGWEEIF